MAQSLFPQPRGSASRLPVRVSCARWASWAPPKPEAASAPIASPTDRAARPAQDAHLPSRTPVQVLDLLRDPLATGNGSPLLETPARMSACGKRPEVTLRALRPLQRLSLHLYLLGEWVGEGAPVQVPGALGTFPLLDRTYPKARTTLIHRPPPQAQAGPRTAVGPDLSPSLTL